MFANSFLKNMIIQTNNNTRRLLVYSTFYRKVKMQLDFFLRDTLPCFASYSLTNFCLLALRDDIQSPREEKECERDCAGLCPTPQFLFLPPCPRSTILRHHGWAFSFSRVLNLHVGFRQTIQTPDQIRFDTKNTRG